MTGKQAKKLDNPILAEHAAEIRRLGKRVAEDVIEIGRRLTECKRIAGHGNWLPWLEREFRWTDKTAERFMSVHALAGKFDNLSDLELPISGLYLLAAPSTPPEARDEIVERAKAGETIPVAEVKRTIARRRNVGTPSRQAKAGAIAATKAVADQVRKPDTDVQATRDNAAKTTHALRGQPEPPDRKDIGAASSPEIAHLARIEELENAKRRLEIENSGLRSEIEELKTERAPESKSASRCSICHEKKHAVQRPVFICGRPRAQPVLGPIVHDHIWQQLAEASERLCDTCMYQRAWDRLGRVLTLADLLPCPCNLFHRPHSWFDFFVEIEGKPPSNLAEFRSAARVLGIAQP